MANNQNKQHNHKPPAAVSVDFAFDQKPVGDFLMTTIKVRRGSNAVAGASVGVTKMPLPATWEEKLVTNSSGQCTFLVPLPATETKILLTAQIMVGNQLPINTSAVWERQTPPPSNSQFLRVTVEETDAPNLVYLQLFTARDEAGHAGASETIRITCLGKKIVGGEFSDTVGGTPRNEFQITTHSDGASLGWVRLEEKGEATITISLTGGRKPFQFKLKNEDKKTSNDIAELILQSDFTISPVFVKVIAKLSKPGKPGQCKLVATQNINATVVGGPNVCSNAKEGTFTTNGETQIQISLPDGVDSATIHVESVADSSIMTKTIIINKRS